ncbi:MAG: DUF5678 domain-containing protein [Acidobacteria bacterium]|nr:DUF5678 domain-containing protein [Acidobacteriota bacterium]
MPEITAETLADQITSLPISQKLKLRSMLDAQLKETGELTNGVKLVEPIKLPDPAPSRRWMNEHAQEYGGQWVALDGDRLIAHGENADEVFAAADADGAYLPLVTYIPPADAPHFAGV